ncbi:NAD-dependent epimerase/dehydratase family protein [Candidatus Pelagibacter sp.]|jgi:UDP-glucuronate 4-epimerase|nr:NAD-dependent epimerase/dehydratase family protein [Candidatus Pelagibacter sp.]
MKILITGVAGFIGYNLAKKLIKKYHVIGIDNINSYYSVKLKKDRIKDLKNKNFKFYKLDITQKEKLFSILEKNKITHIVHLAAQAGVRYSLKFPEKYFRSNLLGTFSILECSKKLKIKNLLLASTSSVYGDNPQKISSENFPADFPIQFYAATKRSTEIMAYSYSCLYKIPTICMRFFTVYGPWGRPDMALFKFTKNIIENKQIDVFNYGKHSRDFTYIDDIALMIISLLKKPPNLKNSIKNPYRIFNLSAGKNVKLMNYIKEIEKNLGKKAKINYLPLQRGDIVNTRSSTKNLRNYVSVKKTTNYKKGIKEFVEWYKNYATK